MSEEEIMKYLESYIQFFSVLKAPEPQDAKMMKAVKGIIDLYNKEKEKNKKIEDKIKGKIEWYQQYCDLDYQTVRALEDILE